MPAMPATPVPSSTVVLLRDGASGVEVLLLVRRPHGSDPFSGASVFPGGVVDPADEAAELAPPRSGFDAERARRELGESVSAALLRSLYVAACRELFEEAGILLARDAVGRPVEARTVASLDAERRHLQAGNTGFAEILAREQLTLGLDTLLPFAHWITPEQQRKRWDTRFFLAVAPPGQEALSDGTETSEAAWLTPPGALEAYHRGAILLAPPTYRVLEEVSTFPDTATALEGVRAGGPPVAILPVPVAASPAPTLLYPGDRDYPGDGRGEGWNRLVMEDGRWRSVRE
jgi:8-oxo-dGTP pyrophosphatase MutT (NUDIX family)